VNIDIDELMKLSHRYRDNPLWDFFLNREHRLITKWLHYFEVYDKWFAKFRGKEIVMIEVGVFMGGSLQMWRDYFGSKAQIIGVDINEDCREYAAEGISIEIGSQDNPNFWNYMKGKYPKVDILLDDGGHTMQQQIITFKEMFPHLADGGVYLCEDTHSSYLSGFDIDKAEMTYMEYMKRIIDEMHAYYKGNPLSVGYNTKNLSGLHFYDSMVVAEKKERRLPPVDFQYKTDENPPYCAFCVGTAKHIKFSDV